MKSILTLLLFSFTIITVFAQHASKPDDALLMDYYQSQRYSEAADYLKKNFPEPVADLNILSRLAYASQMANKLVDAEGYYQRAFDIDTTNSNILFNMAGINLRRGNFPKAEEYYKRLILRDTGNFAVYSQLGSLSERKSDTVAAINYYEHANRINPSDVDVASELADFYTSVKHFDKALNVLNKAAESDPDNIIILLSTVKLTYSESKWPETINACNRLIQLGSVQPLIISDLGISYYHLNNYACGAETFASLTDREQNEYTYYYAALCYKGLKDDIQAINFMNKAINQGISTNIATYYGEIADSNEKLKRPKKAAIAYQKALQFNESPIVYYLLASLYDTKLKDKRNALLYYKKFVTSKLSEKQQTTYAIYAKSRIEQLRN